MNINSIMLLSVILEKTIRIPRSLSVRASSILKGFLNKNPVDRLGCSEAGFGEIMTHQFFKSIEWELVSRSHLLLSRGVQMRNLLDFWITLLRLNIRV